MTADEKGAVYVIVPDGIDDPARPSGGNVYDRRVCRGLAALGWSVRERAVPGTWPWPDASAYVALAALLAAVPDREVVLLDGLVASTASGVLLPEASRLRLVILVHMPIGVDGAAGQSCEQSYAARTGERGVLTAAEAVIVTSSWTRRRLLDCYALQQDRVRVVEPGVDRAALTHGTAAGGEFLCVAAVTPNKGHDVLLAALGMIADLRWHCRFVGSLTSDPVFAELVHQLAHEIGVGDRVALLGPLADGELENAYAAADLLLVAARSETYGMVVTEALARGIPVVATAVGGLGEALGYGLEGERPGRLIPRADPAALATTLREWLGEPQLRSRWRAVAVERRGLLSPWSDTSARISAVLAGLTR